MASPRPRRGDPGLTLELWGALADSASEGARARFSACRSDGAPLVDLGEARRDRRTPPARIEVPGDGRLDLRVGAADPAGCHSVWLWSAPAGGGLTAAGGPC